MQHLVVLLPVLYLPVKHHIESDHVRALGAAYAASVGFFIILFGLGMGGSRTTCVGAVTRAVTCEKL